MFLSVVILGRFTTETHAMALYISADTPPLLTPHPGTLPGWRRGCEGCLECRGGQTSLRLWKVFMIGFFNLWSRSSVSAPAEPFSQV
jgi:hypothetical protein